MNKFYNQSIVVVWVTAVLLLVLGLYPFILLIASGVSIVLVYVLFFLFLPFFQFTTTPILRLTGIYTYYSPMLLGYMVSDTKIDLHSGTNFDYLFVMRKFKKGVETRNTIMMYHMEGLLKIISMIENKRIPGTVNIVATSYFFNKRSMTRLGFKLEEPSLFYRINLLVNFIDIFWMYSLAKGRFTIPKIWDAKKVRIIGSDLVSHKSLIIELHGKLYKTNTLEIKSTLM